MIKENLIKLYEYSCRDNWDLPALSDYSTKENIHYKDLAREIVRIHVLLDEADVQKGDKIALVGKNNIPWCVVYLGVITYGAVIVPILQDFNEEGIQNIVDHSDSKLLFANNATWVALDQKTMKSIENVFSINTLDFSCLYSGDGKMSDALFNLEHAMQLKYPNGFGKQDLDFAEVDNSELVLINYTSGTTGFSKGVMISANNLAGNITYATYLKLLFRGERILSFLPLAHAYGCAFEFLYALSAGVHVTLLGKTPAPRVLAQAFAEVKPHLIVAVPLILEKIYKNAIVPKLSSPSVKLFSKLPLLRDKVYSKFREGLTVAMGGEFRIVIIGGAALNPEVESFLYKIKFPFTVGYGMTECAPLISYDHPVDFIPSSCGKILDDIMEVRIDSNNPYKEIGEIQVRGENVMQGYYKNEEATVNAFTADGWLRTGDMGVVNAANRIFIKGRCKSMLLGSNGQNVYPEEIEARLASMPYVSECLVVQREGGKLVALVYPDYELIEIKAIDKDLGAIMEENRVALNKKSATYENVSHIEIVADEFEKTPKKSIKRYLYM